MRSSPASPAHGFVRFADPAIYIVTQRNGIVNAIAETAQQKRRDADYRDPVVIYQPDS